MDIELVFLLIGIAMSLIVFPVMLVMSKLSEKSNLSLVASAINLAGIIIVVVTLIAVSMTYLL